MPLRATISQLRGDPRVGADFFDRLGLTTPSVPAPRGLIDRMEDYAGPDVDTSRIPLEIQAFFTDTAALELRIETVWHGPVAWLWPLARTLLRAVVGQFVLPLRHGLIRARAVALDAARDGRPGARGIVRTYPDGSPMQVVAYAAHRHDGDGYMSASFPLPFGALLGVLRLVVTGDDPATGLSVALDSARREGRDDDSGVWFTTAHGSLPLPFRERLSLWLPTMPQCPAELASPRPEGVTLVGLHAQRLFGAPFATHRYWFSPAPK